MGAAREKKIWFPDELFYLKNNYYQLTNSQLLEHINVHRSEKVTMSAMLHQCRRLGLKRGIQIRWSEEDTNYLIRHRQKYGNTEIARRLNKRKKTYRVIDGMRVYKHFTKKHVEKKIKLLGIQRDHDTVLAIKRRNIKTGQTPAFTSEDNAWSRGIRQAMKEGETRIQKNVKLHRLMIKIEGQLIPFHRWYYNYFVRQLADNEYVLFRDLDPTNCEESNLYVSDSKFISFEIRVKGIKLLQERIEKLQTEIRMNTRDRIQEREQMKELGRLRNLIKHFSRARRNREYTVERSPKKEVEV